MTCMFRLSQLCTPPSTQTPPAFKRRSACAARSNVLVSAAAQHGVGQALQHRPRACAALRGSAAGVLARDERLSLAGRPHGEPRSPVLLLPLAGTVVDCSGAAAWRRPAPGVMPRKAPPQEPRRGTLDMMMSRASAVRARLGNDEKVSVDYIEACGACSLS